MDNGTGVTITTEVCVVVDVYCRGGAGGVIGGAIEDIVLEVFGGGIITLVIVEEVGVDADFGGMGGAAGTVATEEGFGGESELEDKSGELAGDTAGILPVVELDAGEGVIVFKGKVGTAEVNAAADVLDTFGGTKVFESRGVVVAFDEEEEYELDDSDVFSGLGRTDLGAEGMEVRALG